MICAETTFWEYGSYAILASFNSFINTLTCVVLPCISLQIDKQLFLSSEQGFPLYAPQILFH